MQPKILFLITIAVVLVALGGGYYFFFKSPVAPTDLGSIDLSKISTTTTIGGYTITPIPVESGIPRPNFKKPLVYKTAVSADVKAAFEMQLADVNRLLTADPLDFNAWLRLGILHKMAGDYKAAEEFWLYTSKVWPTSPVSFHNLADLYQNFLNEPAKAQDAANQAALLEESQS